MKKGQRITGNKIVIDSDQIKEFFRGRAEKYNPACAVVSMLYQDHDPSLAQQRDKVEKEVILPILRLKKTDRVLDIGCGIGRWAEVISPRVSFYHGVDMVEELINIARERTRDLKNVTFQIVSAEKVERDILPSSEFDLIILAGVLHYMNDRDFEKTLKGIKSYSRINSRIMIRGPVAIDKRLSLDKFWSEELKSEYSAIYRTKKELLEAFEKFLPEFDLKIGKTLFSPELNNRTETMPYVFLLERK